MGKYRVWAHSVDAVYIDIEAKTPLKARELADKIDGGRFHPDVAHSYWEFAEINTLDDDASVDYIYDKEDTDKDI